MIVAGSLRQLPYSLRVEGRQTYIVGYAFTPTGVEEPTVGNDWYPLDLDVYDNQEHASVDAYIASEEGQATLQGCGVSALVPLATAVARLADNDINITVKNPTLFNRQVPEESDNLLVVADGKVALFINENEEAFAMRKTTGSTYVTVNSGNISAITALWGQQMVGTFTTGQNFNVSVEGMSYTFTASGNNYTMVPAAGIYGQ